MKRTITLLTFALALTSAWASVLINETNFPDENLRNLATEHDADENGVLSDDELAEITEIRGEIMNLKGAEHFKNVDYICLWYGSAENPSIESIDPSLFPKLYYFSLSDCGGVTSLDLSKNTQLTNFELVRCPNISMLKLPASVEFVGLEAKGLTSLDVSQLSNLVLFNMWDSGITDLDFSNNPVLSSIGITGSEDGKQVLNSLNLENCNALENIDIRYTTLKTLTMKHLPTVRSLMLLNNDVTSTTIEDCAEFMSITCDQNVLGTLYVKDNPSLQAINTEDNYLQVFIADKCPKLGTVKAFNNRLMWLDLKDVKKAENIEESILQIDNQTPNVVAWKLSPTEVGLLVHERFDVSRVLNLKAKGLSMTPRETTVDGIRYFVIYNNGPDVASLVGAANSYEYVTQWPYPWMDDNTKDNNLPVSLKVTSWEKPASWIKLSAASVTALWNDPIVAPTVSRSQDYDGQLTYKSGNENVVKVDAATGVLTPVGPGTATITVTGAETDYRKAPAPVSYIVSISLRPGDANADGRVDFKDVQITVDYLLGKAPAGFHATAANVSGDNKVDIADVAGIVSIILGK